MFISELQVGDVYMDELGLFWLKTRNSNGDRPAHHKYIVQTPTEYKLVGHEQGIPYEDEHCEKIGTIDDLVNGSLNIPMTNL